MVQDEIDFLDEISIEMTSTSCSVNVSSSNENNSDDAVDFSSDSANIEPFLGDKISVFGHEKMNNSPQWSTRKKKMYFLTCIMIT